MSNKKRTKISSHLDEIHEYLGRMNYQKSVMISFVHDLFTWMSEKQVAEDFRTWVIENECAYVEIDPLTGLPYKESFELEEQRALEEDRQWEEANLKEPQLNQTDKE